MNSLELLKPWKVTQANLEHARAMLPPPSPEIASEYQRLLLNYTEYLDHNELELAMNVLQDIGNLVPCRGGYWRNLERAAKTMRLDHRIPYFRKRFEQSGTKYNREQQATN